MEKGYIEFAKKHSYVLKFLISVLILYFVFSKVDFVSVFKVLKEVSLFDIFVLVILNFVSFFIMVAKWRVILFRYFRIGYWKLSSIYLASDFVNLFFLGTLGGEAYKVLYSSEKKSVFFTSVFDRLYSFKAYFLVAVFLFVLYFNGHYVVTSLVFILFMLMFYYLYIPVLEFFKFGKLQKILSYAKLSLREIVIHNLLSVLYLLSYAVRVWFVFYVFGFSFNLFVLMIFSALVVVAISVPVSVQGLGVREFLFLQFGLLFAVPVEVATAASLLIYFSGLVYRLFGVVPFLMNKKD